MHNFVSNIAGGKLVSELYRALMGARRIKLVLLSGTPLVNEPQEIAYLANLVSGPIVVHEVPISTRGLTADSERRLGASKHVHEYWEEQRDGGARHALCVRLVPEGFERAPGDSTGTFVVRSPPTERSRGDLERLEAVIADADLGALVKGEKKPSRRELELLPSDKDAFLAAYVTEGGDALKHADALAARLLGTISFFQDPDLSLYPQRRSTLLVRLPLSPRQFSEYATLRTDEMKREMAARRFAAARGGPKAGAASSSGVGMRPFSRAACTFVFPEGIARPRRGLLSSDDHGDEENEGGGKKKSTTADQAYSLAIDAAIQALRELPPSALSAGAGLALLSPKFDDVVARLKGLAGVGTAIVYSQFRRAEGVAILAVAMEANGFVELVVVGGAEHQKEDDERRAAAAGGLRAAVALGGRVLEGKELTPELLARPRYIMYDANDERGMNALLSVFNNRPEEAPRSFRESLELLSPGGKALTNLRGEQARAMLITRSGAEGISTRNVREVLVIEPFWHANRIDQVIGRARRMHSHDDLPPGDRTVDVRVYMATFSPEQATSFRKDAYLTSDEYVHDIAQRKRKLLNQLLEVMKSAAVDCSHSSDPSACVAAPAGAGPQHPMFSVRGAAV